MTSPRIYDRHEGKPGVPPVFGTGCLYDALGMALPVLVLALSIGAFALIWWLKGDSHRAGIGSAGIALYGMLVLVPLYVPYTIGFVVARIVAHSWRLRTVVAPLAVFALTITLGVLALALGSPAVTALLGLFAVFVAVPALGAAVSLAARAAADDGTQQP